MSPGDPSTGKWNERGFGETSMMHDGTGAWHWGFGFGHWGIGVLIWLVIIVAVIALLKWLVEK